jgi:hypothetical protein
MAQGLVFSPINMRQSIRVARMKEGALTPFKEEFLVEK